jgi:HEAT repeat protein
LSQEDHLVVNRAAAVVSRIGPGAHEAIPALAQVMNKKQQDDVPRVMAATALGNIGPRSLPVLTEALKKGDVFLRRQAASAMGHMSRDHETGVFWPDSTPAIPLLIDALNDDDNDDFHIRVRDIARENLLVLFREDAVPHLRQALKSEVPVIRAGVANVLFRLAPDETVTDVLLQSLSSSDLEVRSCAAQTFSLVGGPGHIYLKTHAKKFAPVLTKMLADTNEYVRFDGALGLGILGPAAREAVPGLVKMLLGEKNDWVRGIAAHTLGKIGPAAKDAIPALIRVAKEDEMDETRIDAMIALGNMGPAALAAIPVLEEALTDRAEEISAAASSVLQKMRELEKSNK